MRGTDGKNSRLVWPRKKGGEMASKKHNPAAIAGAKVVNKIA